MSKEKKLAKNVFIISIGKVCTQLITFLLLPLYTTYLSTEQFGIVDLLNTLVSLLIPIITLQLEQGSFRLLIDCRKDEEKTKSIITTTLSFLFIQISLYIILFCIFSKFVNNDYKYFLLTNVVACVFSTILLQIVRGIGNNAGYAKASFINAFCTILFNLLFIVVFKKAAYGMLTGTCLGYICSIAYMLFILKVYKYFNLKKYDNNVLKNMIKYSIPLIPNIISWWIVNVSDRSLVTYFLGIAQNGILSAANKFPHVLTTLYSVFNMAWTESAALNINSNDRDKFFSRVFDITLKIFGSACLMVIAVLPFAFPMLINEKFSDAYIQIPILMVAVIFNILVSFLGSIYVAIKKTKEIAKTSVIAAIINLLINIVFIKRIGLFAATISTFTAYFVMYIYRWYDSKKYVVLKYNKKLVLSMIFSFIFVIIFYYINNKVLCGLVLVITGIYCMYINKDSFKFIFEILKNKKNSMVRS